MTGDFGGAVVGASSMECSRPWTTRGNCYDRWHWFDHCRAQNSRHHDSDACVTMTPVEHPQHVAGIPADATIVSATLTWAATAPADTDDSSGLSSAALHVTSADGTALVDDPVTGAPIATGEPAGIDVHAADVTDLLRPAHIVAALRAGGSVVADGIDASPTSSGSWSPMAGWALSVIWSSPGLHGTVQLSDRGTYSSPSDGSATVELATDGAPITGLTTVLWATDPWGQKGVSVNGRELTVTPIMGVGDDPSGDGQVATGVDVVSVTAGPRAASTPTDGTADATLSNHTRAALCPSTSRSDDDQDDCRWALSVGSSDQDGLWIGPTLVIRDAGSSPPAS